MAINNYTPITWDNSQVSTKPHSLLKIYSASILHYTTLHYPTLPHHSLPLPFKHHSIRNIPSTAVSVHTRDITVLYRILYCSTSGLTWYTVIVTTTMWTHACTHTHHHHHRSLTSHYTQPYCHISNSMRQPITRAAKMADYHQLNYSPEQAYLTTHCLICPSEMCLT